MIRPGATPEPSHDPRRDGPLAPDPGGLAPRLVGRRPPAHARALPGPPPDRLRPVQRHHLRRPHRPAGRNRPGLGPPLQCPGPRRPGLPPQRRTPPPFTEQQLKRIVDAVELTEPRRCGLPGHLWTSKELRQWVVRTFGRPASRSTPRRLLRQAGLSWKEVKELLGKADPDKRAAHVQQLLQLFAGVCRGEVVLLSVDAVQVHRDPDLGYTWGRRGQRVWRVSDCPKLQGRRNAYGACDFSNGACLLWQDGWCHGAQAVQFLQALVAWRAGKQGRLVLIWDNAPCHVAKVVTAEAARLGIAVVNRPGYSPDLNPGERLWDWLRDGVRRGHCHASVPALIEACEAFVARINRDPVALVDRLWPKFELDPEFEAKLRVST